MAQKQWFSVKSSENAQVVYLVAADSELAADVVGRAIGGKPIIKRLSWQELHDISGGIIPAGSNPHALASGNFMLLRLDKPDVVLWPL